ncbi:conserved hypothetical protein [Shewanella denitrificans OS217]|jgi:hypothetical protein|uniref:Lipoprotein n=1 Tax=Shewanella denitrificans (strain OS217 / ATCC BAA-1090 / DSM 15013) TaxID=318161 RepID=Q12P24_SHEDO|nr:DUF3192 domain-containing protein [Shewanella denitrificans]ABE54802.1 conserved hypothetical protein [Shewanella denitrificans OS217]
MKSKLIPIAMLTSLSLLMSGCVLNVGEHGSARNSDWEQQQQMNRDNIAKLSMGMDAQQVSLLMGTADFSEAFVTQASAQDAEQQVQVFFYRTQWSKGDGKTTKDECTPVVLRNNKLIGWGDAAYKMI